MTFQTVNDHYLLRLMPGEELVTTLTNFCQQQKIFGGSVTGLGAAREVELAHFNVSTKQYSKKNFTGTTNSPKFFEVVNITGNISVEKIHLHMTISDDQLHTYGGHCLRCVGDPTLELMIIPFTETHRRPDNYCGLDLLDLPSQSV